MSQRAFINMKTLQLIINNAQVSLNYLEKKIKINKNSNITSWFDEKSGKLPTFIQAKGIARVLRVPFAGLYMLPEHIPLHKIPRFIQYRTLQDSLCQDDSALNLAIFELLDYRDLFKSLNDTLTDNITPFNINLDINVTASDLADKIREIFTIDINEQFTKASKRQFYLYIRNKVEEKGIFINSFSGVSIQLARGLSIYESDPPIIGINSNDGYAAKTFTIIHELVHLLRHESACCNDLFDSFSENQEEIFCNSVAGEMLVPKQYLEEILTNNFQNITISCEIINELAHIFSVSNDVIARRLLDTNKIEKYEYTNFIDYFRKERKALKDNKEKSLKKFFYKPPFRNIIDMVSHNLLLSMAKGYDKKILSIVDISQYLGININNATKLISNIS